MRCPHCHKQLNERELLELMDPKSIVSFANALAGRSGRGAAKARSSEQARAAVQARWAKRDKEEAKANAEPPRKRPRKRLPTGLS